MPLTLDPQLAAVLAPIAAAMADVIPPPAGDVMSRRPILDALMAQTAALQAMPADVTITDHRVSAADGIEILVRQYARHDVAPGSGVLYLHGGGMISGSVALYDGPVARYVSASGVPMWSVDYRLAPENPHPAPVEDAYAALQWLASHAAEFGVQPGRIAVMGDSAGGGLAASLAQLARDREGPALAAQILIYPMLDDRTTTPDPEIAPFAVWSYDDNITGWSALLGAVAGGPDVPAYAAAARTPDLHGLPPTYLEVGQLDIFRDESLAYAQRLGRAGIGVEFHLRPGAPHEFETYGYATDVARRATADRARVLAAL